MTGSWRIRTVLNASGKTIRVQDTGILENCTEWIHAEEHLRRCDVWRRILHVSGNAHIMQVWGAPSCVSPAYIFLCCGIKYGFLSHRQRRLWNVLPIEYRWNSQWPAVKISSSFRGKGKNSIPSSVLLKTRLSTCAPSRTSVAGSPGRLLPAVCLNWWKIPECYHAIDEFCFEDAKQEALMAYSFCGYQMSPTFRWYDREFYPTTPVSKADGTMRCTSRIWYTLQNFYYLFVSGWNSPWVSPF